MSASLNSTNYLKKFLLLNHKEIKFQTPLILQMYGTLNKINMRKELNWFYSGYKDNQDHKPHRFKPKHKEWCRCIKCLYYWDGFFAGNKDSIRKILK